MPEKCSKEDPEHFSYAQLVGSGCTWSTVWRGWLLLTVISLGLYMGATATHAIVPDHWTYTSASTLWIQHETGNATALLFVPIALPLMAPLKVYEHWDAVKQYARAWARTFADFLDRAFWAMWDAVDQQLGPAIWQLSHQIWEDLIIGILVQVGRLVLDLVLWLVLWTWRLGLLGVEWLAVLLALSFSMASWLWSVSFHPLLTGIGSIMAATVAWIG